MVIVLPDVLAVGVSLTGISVINGSSDRNKKTKEPRAAEEPHAPGESVFFKITMLIRGGLRPHWAVASLLLSHVDFLLTADLGL